MPTFVGRIENNQIILNSSVQISGLQTPGKLYRSLLDTGAQPTMISPKIISEVQLQPTGDGKIIPASGETIDTLEFRVRIDIPIQSGIVSSDGKTIPNVVYMGKDLDAFELPYQPAQYDVLLGLDFVSLFHLTIYRDNFILSN